MDIKVVCRKSLDASEMLIKCKIEVLFTNNLLCAGRCTPCRYCLCHLLLTLMGQGCDDDCPLADEKLGC